ncbi:MAG TPA: B-box zinc finger protein [Myxococcaceae bacterium]|jgi:hypothetical protein
MAEHADIGQVCPVHPGVPAHEVCARCGRFLCVDCSVYRKDAWYCQACAQRMVGLFAGSWFAIVAGICSFIGLGCAPLAALAAVLALSDLAMIASGRNAKGGWKLDLIALGLSALGLVIGIFLIQRLGLLSATH